MSEYPIASDSADPMDAGPSLYQHLGGWFFNAEEVSMAGHKQQLQAKPLLW
jgi:hypothetical protein